MIEMMHVKTRCCSKQRSLILHDKNQSWMQNTAHYICARHDSCQNSVAQNVTKRIIKTAIVGLSSLKMHNSILKMKNKVKT